MSRHVASLVAAVMLLPVAAGAGYAVLALPEAYQGLSREIAANLRASGVENPVTAVLLNFRGYDTLLEIAVLSLAVIGIWSLAEMPVRRLVNPALVLEFLVQVLAPFMILLGGYLLWAGAHAPGGAFQAGAVLAAAAVLMMLSGVPPPTRAAESGLRGLLVLGLVTFLAAGAAMIAAGGRFLEYPPAYAKHLILLIETAAALSIAAILATAFRGGRPRSPEGAS